MNLSCAPDEILANLFLCYELARVFAPLTESLERKLLLFNLFSILRENQPLNLNNYFFINDEVGIIQMGPSVGGVRNWIKIEVLNLETFLFYP